MRPRMNKDDIVKVLAGLASNPIFLGKLYVLTATQIAKIIDDVFCEMMKDSEETHSANPELDALIKKRFGEE